MLQSQIQDTDLSNGQPNYIHMYLYHVKNRKLEEQLKQAEERPQYELNIP